ncbi:MAG: thermonuclease family protein [Desulfovibrio sp.]|jgi:endonuclease YncB( thermonuclease family)|nr:thermonuclease family protein [Desulfovibrio sp.]
MLKLAVALYFFVAFSSLTAHAATFPTARAVDGDTILTTYRGGAVRVRLYGIDAPEKRQEYGPQATAYVDRAAARIARIEPITTDRYGRMVAIVHMTDGSTLEAMLLAAGLAWVYPQYCALPVCADWQEIEARARAQRIGLWAGEAVEPWRWRRRKGQ